MEHTPGPWEACHNGTCRCKMVWSRSANHPVANIIAGEWGDDYPDIRMIDGKPQAYMDQITYGEIDEEAAQANARLIAAAPELLEAAKALIIDAIDREECFDADTGEWFEDWKALQNAINKADMNDTQKKIGSQITMTARSQIARPD